MSNYLKELRAKSKASLGELVQQVEDSKKTSYGDDRFWKISVDAAGNGEAVIRFLPPKEGESVRWVEKYSHTFEGPSGKYYSENCPTTIKGLDCPVCDANKLIHKQHEKELALKMTKDTKRSHKWFSNILVVDDPKNPENNGKVFLFEYGLKIYSKIEEALKPVSARKKAIQPFDLDEGANFLLVAKTVNKQRNYDSSEFEKVSPISTDDEVIEKIVNSLYSLEAITDKANFKSYEELQTILNRVNGTKTVSREVEREEEKEEDFTEYKSQKSDLDVDELPF